MKAFRLIVWGVGAWWGISRLYKSLKAASKDVVEEASEDSFPASDAPSWNSR